eukprot:TRINITY_DN25758_c0_g1_i1.p1 TRINITY_DN25758_c0_g1~~TRINITY_DN25758_c0_g1_i1.p1  ORF type:complete len:608 (-),score=104.67 TRINITY_DN25758_c0_g1_i1:763-2586(-)
MSSASHSYYLPQAAVALAHALPSLGRQPLTLLGEVARAVDAFPAAGPSWSDRARNANGGTPEEASGRWLLGHDRSQQPGLHAGKETSLEDELVSASVAPMLPTVRDHVGHVQDHCAVNVAAEQRGASGQNTKLRRTRRSSAGYCRTLTPIGSKSEGGVILPAEQDSSVADEAGPWRASTSSTAHQSDVEEHDEDDVSMLEPYATQWSETQHVIATSSPASEPMEMIADRQVQGTAPANDEDVTAAPISLEDSSSDDEIDARILRLMLGADDETALACTIESTSAFSDCDSRSTSGAACDDLVICSEHTADKESGTGTGKEEAAQMLEAWLALQASGDDHTQLRCKPEDDSSGTPSSSALSSPIRDACSVAADRQRLQASSGAEDDAFWTTLLRAVDDQQRRAKEPTEAPWQEAALLLRTLKPTLVGSQAAAAAVRDIASALTQATSRGDITQMKTILTEVCIIGAREDLQPTLCGKISTAADGNVSEGSLPAGLALAIHAAASSNDVECTVAGLCCLWNCARLPPHLRHRVARLAADALFAAISLQHCAAIEWGARIAWLLSEDSKTKEELASHPLAEALRRSCQKHELSAPARRWVRRATRRLDES